MTHTTDVSHTQDAQYPNVLAGRVDLTPLNDAVAHEACVAVHIAVHVAVRVAVCVAVCVAPRGEE